MRASRWRGPAPSRRTPGWWQNCGAGCRAGLFGVGMGDDQLYPAAGGTAAHMLGRADEGDPLALAFDPLGGEAGGQLRMFEQGFEQGVFHFDGHDEGQHDARHR
jgi:hypothetical protein